MLIPCENAASLGPPASSSLRRTHSLWNPSNDKSEESGCVKLLCVVNWNILAAAPQVCLLSIINVDQPEVDLLLFRL